MINKCPVCKKQFDVLWPHMWAYKAEKGRYYCSWKCLRASERKGEEKHMGAKRLLTEEQESHAISLAINRQDPRPYLAECGFKDPQQAWNRIRNNVKSSDPDTFAKLPKVIGHKRRPKIETPEGTLADAMAGMKDAADTFFGKCKDMGLKIETPEAPKVTQPVNYDGMTVREVEGLFGRYRRSDVNGATYIDVEIQDGCDTLSYTVDQWRNFRKEHDRAAAILGVEL